MISQGCCPEVLRRTPDQRTPRFDYDAFATSQTSPLPRKGATYRPTHLRRCGFNSCVEIGSQPGRLDQAATSGLDGFGLLAIGDIVSSGFRRVGNRPCEVTDPLYDYAFIRDFIQP